VYTDAAAVRLSGMVPSVYDASSAARWNDMVVRTSVPSTTITISMIMYLLGQRPHELAKWANDDGGSGLSPS
jgi:hypothetical protein